MPPRWFKNIKFGKDVTNLPPEQVLDNLKATLQGKIDEISFGSTIDQVSFPQVGPIIEEIFSEPEEIYSEPEEILPEPEEILPEPEQIPPEPEEILPEPEEILPEPEQIPPEPEEILPEPEEILPEPQGILPEPEEILSEHEEILPEHEAILPEPEEVLPELEEEHTRPCPPILLERPGLRRSNRQRYAPLDFARGERLIYRRAGEAFEIVGKEPGFPAKRQYGRKKTKPVRPPSNAVPVAPIELKDAKKGNYKFSSKQIHSQIAGCIRLEPGASKPEARINQRQSFVFLVRSGQVIIKVRAENPDEGKNYLADQKSGWIVLEQGQKYSIRNCGMKTADVIYFLMDMKN